MEKISGGQNGDVVIEHLNGSSQQEKGTGYRRKLLLNDDINIGILPPFSLWFWAPPSMLSSTSSPILTFLSWSRLVSEGGPRVLAHTQI
jgi:hypothetical protein